MERHVIPDETEFIPPDTHPYCGSIFKVPLVQRYNTRVRRLKGDNIMANHMTTIILPRKIPTLVPTNITVHKTGEDWAHINSTTGKFTIQPGLINAFICPDTGKYQ